MRTVNRGFGLTLQIGRDFLPILETFDCSKNLSHGVRFGLRICARDWIARVCIDSGIIFDGVLKMEFLFQVCSAMVLANRVGCSAFSMF
jgi:hypothetical protein